MHALFIPYGKRSEVELLLRDMEAQKHKLLLTKGKQKKVLWIQGQVRLLPFGIYEYIFPKPDMNVVLTTLGFKKDRYALGNLKLAFLRKAVGAEKIPKFKEGTKYLWVIENVNIIPLGVRYDAEDYIDDEGENKGWIHEAI